MNHGTIRSLLAVGGIALTAVASSTAEAHVVARSGAPAVRLAPADEYFGPLKISILGMRNILRDQTARYAANPATGDDVVHEIVMVEAAVRDWARKYPRDYDIPRTIYFVERAYDRIHTGTGESHELATRSWLFSRYGTSPQAKQLRRDLAVESARAATREAIVAPSTEGSPSAPAALAPGIASPEPK